MAESGVVCDPSELDRLIHSYQCENEQLLKLIDIEKQHNEAIEKEIESKKEDIKHLELSNSKLDEETRRAHKQFTINRDNCESLKKTLIVLKEHEEALTRKLGSEKLTNQNERLEREQILKHYMNIWNNYEAKYESFPLAKHLRQNEMEVEDLKKSVSELENKRNELQTKIEQVKAERESGDFRKFCIRIAKIKVSTEAKKKDIERTLQEKLKIEEKIKETEEEKQKENEKKEAEEREAKEREAEEREAEIMDCDNMEESLLAHHQDQSIDHNNNKTGEGDDDESMMISIYNDKDAIKSVEDHGDKGRESPTLQQLGSSSQILHPLISSQPTQTTKTASVQPQKQGYFRAPDSSQSSLPVPTFRTPLPTFTIPTIQKQPSQIRSVLPQSKGPGQQSIPAAPVVCRMPSITRPQLAQQQDKRITIPQCQVSSRPPQVLGIPQVSVSPSAQQFRQSSETQKLTSPSVTSLNSPARSYVVKQASTQIEMQPIPVPLSPRVHNGVEQTLVSQSPRVHSRVESIPVLQIPKLQSRLELVPVPSQSPRVQSKIASMPLSKRFRAQDKIEQMLIPQSPRVNNRVEQPGSAQTEMNDGLVYEKVDSSDSNVPESQSPVAPQSPEDDETSEGKATDSSMHKTPEMVRKNTEAKTPESQRMECESSSPFDFEKHQKRLQELRKSPGFMKFEGRPMFDSNKVSDVHVEDRMDDTTGSFMFSSSFFKSPNVTSNPNNMGSSKVNDQNEIEAKSPKPAAVASVSSPKDFMFSSEQSGKFSFGNETLQKENTSLMSLFGGNQNSPDLGGNTQEHSFSLDFSTSTSSANISSPVIPTSFGNSASSNLLSLFGSPSTTQNSPCTSDSFTLNFASSSTGKDKFPEFSFAFGGSGDSAAAGSSLLSLFGSPQEEAEGQGDDNFTLQFGGGDTLKPNKSFKLF